MTQRQSTLPNNTSIRLPPLSPPLQSHPQTFNNSSVPVVYSLKLSESVVKTLLSAPSTTSVRFNDSKSAEILIPNANPPSIPLSVRAIADGDASTARAACYTRRNKSLRTVGPIVADLDLVVPRTVDKSASRVIKERTMKARNSGKRDLQVIEDIPAQPPKKLRKKPAEKPAAKRPRPPRRATPSASIASSSKPTPPHANGSRVPRTGPTPPANASPSFPSPAVSPGHANGKATPSMTTPTRNAFSALQSRKVSPASMGSNLPKPVRRTPTKQNRFSPVGSRGPSPRINSPGSPRVTGIRPPRVGDHAELRRQLVHFLAMGENDLRTITERLESRRIEFLPQSLTSILREVADMKDGKYTLKEKSWAEVSENFEYSDMEQKMKVYKAEVGIDGEDKQRMGSMSDQQLDAAMDNFRKDYKDTEERITSEKDEADMRKAFTSLFPLYTEVITRMEGLQNMFKTLETRFLAAKSKEKESIGRQIVNNHRKYKVRHSKFERILPLLHARMKAIRRALDDYMSSDENR